MQSIPFRSVVQRLQYLYISLKISKAIKIVNCDLYLGTEMWNRLLLAVLEVVELSFIYVYITCKFSYVV